MKRQEARTAVPQRLVLPPDVLIEPVSPLPPETRDRMDCDSTDFIVSRPRTRVPSTVINQDMAKLLEFFRSPSSIVDAVVEFSRGAAVDPRATLEAAFGPLRALMADRLLVIAGSEAERPIDATLAPGACFDELRIIEVVHLLDDTEVYRGRTVDGTDVAVKVAGPAATPQILAALDNEEMVLKQLGGEAGPELVGSGRISGRRYIATGWQHGCDLYEAAAKARELGGRQADEELVHLGEQVLTAYALLHGRGLLHGDIHPRNMLVDGRGQVTLVDFGLAAPIGSDARFLLGGIDIFQAPEVSMAALAGEQPPPLTVGAEIYSLGAVLYQLFTGQPTHAFSLRRTEMNRQLSEDPPLPFAVHRSGDLQQIEGVVRQALAKGPGDRFATVAEMLTSFRAAAVLDRAGTAAANGRPRDRLPAALRTLDRFQAPGQSFRRGLVPPTASIVYGGAGLAYAFLRAARHGADAAALAGADLWASRAEHQLAADGAFWTADLGVAADTFGRTSLFHGAAGVHCVQSLVAHARGDGLRQAASVESFIEATAAAERRDVLFGRSGLLLGCAFLLDTLPAGDLAGRLRAHADGLLAGLWHEIDRQPPISRCAQIPLLGAAHGWAGLLYATILWCEASGTAVPDQLPDRLQQLAGLGRSYGRCVLWPRRNDGGPDNPLLAASWCNGAAGHVHLWAAAHRLYGDEESRRLACMAGWGAVEGPLDVLGDLCCGLAGRAYALLRLYRDFGEERWLARAAALMKHAAAPGQGPGLRPHSLFHGDVGTALAAADTESGGGCGMPFFEREGWTGSGPAGRYCPPLVTGEKHFRP